MEVDPAGFEHISEDRVKTGPAIALAFLLGGGLGLSGGNELGTLSTKQEISACLGIELPYATTPEQVTNVLERCLPGDELAIARKALMEKLRAQAAQK